MFRRLASMAVFLSLLIGCTRVVTVNPNAPDESFAELNRRGANRKGTIVLQDATRIEAASIVMQPELTSFTSPETGLPATIETTQIRSIQFKRRSEGFVVGCLGGLTGNTRVGTSYILPFQQHLLPAELPILTGDFPVSGLEIRVLSSAVQIPLELGDVPLLAVVSTYLIENFDENTQEGVDLDLADHIGFLIDVEQDTL